MEEERDLVVFSDDEGNEFELEVIDYFDYEGQEHAILIDPSVGDDEDESAETEVYIMKVVVNGEYEEFLPADEDKMDALSAIVEKMFDEWENEEGGCDCGCEDGCDCGCDDNCAHGESCDCGCDAEK